MAINFTPKFHKQITEGMYAGTWIAVPPPAESADYKTDLFAANQIEERGRLEAAGETIFVMQVKT